MTAFKKAVKYILLVALICLPFVVYFHAQALVDWWKLRGYTPPASIATLAAQDTMTAYARHIFYVNHPDLESNVTQFRSDCGVAEQAIVLGCYQSNQNGIFIYQVSDLRLQGVEQVTAAHEMLHGAYDRLSSKDRQYVDGLLENYYNHDLSDQRIKDEINDYKKTEPNDLVNEMNSIFGTEIASLPSPLETYYARYFTNRAAVTGFAAAYEGEFTSRENQIKADDAQLAVLKTKIQNQEDALQSQLSKINADRSQLDSQRASGDIRDYNAGVASFNNEVDAYNAGVRSLRADINSYNQLVVARNAIAQELTTLDQALDTRLAPQTQ